MTDENTSPLQERRYIRMSVTATSNATVRVQAIYEKRGWRKWLAVLLRKPVTETVDITDTASARPTPDSLRRLTSENRDALQAALPYMEGASFSSQYAREQVKRQIEACQAALDASVDTSLEAKLGKELIATPSYPEGDYWNSALKKAIAIARQHFAEGGNP